MCGLMYFSHSKKKKKNGVDKESDWQEESLMTFVSLKSYQIKSLIMYKYMT